MSIEGSISVSALFHDKDGTTAMKVVSLRSANEYTTGKVAIVTGTVGTTAVSFGTFDDGSPTTSNYRDASGDLVSFNQITRVASRSNSGTISLVGPTFDLEVSSGNVALIPCGVANPESFSVAASTGTASYTIVIYGS